MVVTVILVKTFKIECFGNLNSTECSSNDKNQYKMYASQILKLRTIWYYLLQQHSYKSLDKVRC